MNWRRHPEHQKRTLEALYEEVGFARSLLAFETPDGRLQLIDGHLRRDLTPDSVVTVEVLDVDEADARKLLLSMDPLAGLAVADEDTLDALRRITPAEHDILNDLWAGAETGPPDGPGTDPDDAAPDQFLILITCGSESEQAELLGRLTGEGLDCRPLTSFG